jgi:hypothetical protein
MSGIIRRLIRIATTTLMRLLPLDLKRSRGWQLTEGDQQRLIQRLLTKADKRLPYAGKRVLFWEPGGMRVQLARHAIVATALRLRGVEGQLVICDGAPSACIQREIRFDTPPSRWGETCPNCFRLCRERAAMYNVPCVGIGSLVSEERRSELRALVGGLPSDKLVTFKHRGVEVGQFMNTSLIRYLQGKPPEGHEDAAREFLYGSLVYTEAAIMAVERFKPDYVFMSHGCYVDYGPALAAATNAGIPVTHWGGSYLENHYYIRTVTQSFNPNRRSLSAEAWQQRVERPLTQRENSLLDSYLNARYTADLSFDIRLSQQPDSPEDLRSKLDLPSDKPVWCIFLHLSWDSILETAPMVFDTIESWVLDTLQTIIKLPEVTWLVKVHPAEVSTNTLLGTQSLIEDNFPQLPSHVRIIPPDSDINAYGLYQLLDGGVTVFGTAGLELAILGKPVILAGDTHFGNKGFTYDAQTKEEYEALLRRAARLPKLSPEQQALARQYAYSYLIQRQIPLRMLKDGYMGRGTLDYRKLDLLLPGKDRALDMICERILEGGDFIMDEDAVNFYAALKPVPVDDDNAFERWHELAG